MHGMQGLDGWPDSQSLLLLVAFSWPLSLEFLLVERFPFRHTLCRSPLIATWVGSRSSTCPACKNKGNKAKRG